mmetsp:Transcript_71580/g.158295  ORF Transcript_71580/g.158295 Transcript_71580/m.158295 type:complete len:179 (+) Transcript_71580:1-537(+)
MGGLVGGLLASCGPPGAFQGALSTEVEAFIQMSQVDAESAQRLRTLAPHLQRLVVDRGPVAGSRNPSSVLICRIRDAEMGRVGTPGVGTGALAASAAAAAFQPPNPQIEALISRYKIDANASNFLRQLTPAKQKQACELPLHEARNPSAFIMTQLATPGGVQASRLPTQPRDPTASLF